MSYPVQAKSIRTNVEVGHRVERVRNQVLAKVIIEETSYGQLYSSTP